MRKLVGVALAVVTLALGTAAKIDKLEAYERDHYQMLRVWFDKEAKEEKQYFKLKTPQERDQWLKDKGYWDRFYKYDEVDRAKMLTREPKVGWKQDWVYMAWGEPFRKLKNTKRSAADSIILSYRIEVTKDGDYQIWQPDSKATYKAIKQIQADLWVDDHVVTEIVETDGWK